MKISITLSAILMIATLFAQSPQKMSYQALVRDASNNLVTNTTIGMKVSILKTLKSIPNNSKVIIDNSKNKFLTYDVVELISEFELSAQNKNITIIKSNEIKECA